VTSRLNCYEFLQNVSIIVFFLSGLLNGKPLGVVGAIGIKEIKYKKFRFYFLADGFKLKFYSVEELTDVPLRFVRMSNKKTQQKTISEIKEVLRNIGPAGFN
jgi:hypothetical protein